MQPYFAALPPDELCRDLMHKKEMYYQWLMISGRLGRMRMAFDSYYGQRGQQNSSYVSQAGEQGELSFLMSNEYRNLVQHLLVLTTQNRPSIELAAVNTDKKSQDQAILGKQLLDYYRREGGLDKHSKLALEIALIMDTSWVFTEWDVTKNDEVRPDESGNMIYKGDIVSKVRTPIDVVIDYTREAGMEHDWQISRDLVNKYDLAAQYPDKAEEIIGCQRDRTKDAMYRFGDQAFYGFENMDSPLIERFTFYHKKSPSLKAGRVFQFINQKLWLHDSGMPYRRLPGRRVCPTEMIASGLGYSNTNDLLALQDVMDALVSAAVTNMTSAGINNIWAKPNSNIDFEQLSSGMNFIESEEKPEVLVLNKLSPEWFNLTNWIVARMEAYSGVNSVARGNTEGKDLSGAAMALLQSMSIQFNSGLQQAYNQLIEDINNDALYLLQDFAKNERTVLIAGESGKYMVKNFVADDLKDIQRVFCRQANSMQDTTPGKLTILKDLMAIPGVIKNADQYLQVLQTGQLTPAIEDETSKLLRIRDENEKLAKGEQVLALAYEDHPRHLTAHVACMEANKDNPQAIAAFDQHIQHTLEVWSQADPIILQVLGIPPISVPIAPMGMGQTGAGGEQQVNSSMQAPPEAGGPEPEPAEAPNLPTNPMTQEQWNPATGGLQ